jgi:hypothetical protein
MCPPHWIVNTTRLVSRSSTYSSPRAHPTASMTPLGCHATLRARLLSLRRRTSLWSVADHTRTVLSSPAVAYSALNGWQSSPHTSPAISGGLTCRAVEQIPCFWTKSSSEVSMTVLARYPAGSCA